jgi:threonine/homoserine/homoserine lactone efflux protein
MVVSTPALLGLAAVALGMVLAPGPNMIYLLSRSITQGRRAGLISLTGTYVGFLVYLLAATAGVATLFTVVPALYLALKLAGAGYLLWLAWNAIRPNGESAFAPRRLAKDPPRRLFAMGLITNLLNPKAAVLYVSLLPQFVDTSKGHVAGQIMILGLTHIAISITVNFVLVITAGSVSRFLASRPFWLRLQRYLMGTVLAGIAVRLAAD